MGEEGSMFFLPPMAAGSLPIGGAAGATPETAPAGDTAEGVTVETVPAAGTAGGMKLQKAQTMMSPVSPPINSNAGNDEAKRTLFKILMFVCIPLAVVIGSIISS